MINLKNKKIGIIFDLDGTVLNTLDDLADAVNYALEYYRYPQRTYEEIRNFVGNGVKLLIQRAVPKNITNKELEKVFVLFKNYYSNNLHNKTRPYEGIISLMETLRQENIIMGIVSNKYQSAVSLLNQDFFKEYIDVAIGTRENMKTKPDPEAVDLAIEELRLNKKKDIIYYVGDSDVDIMTARNASLPIISVTWGFRAKEELASFNPDYLIDSPEEILSIIKMKK